MFLNPENLLWAGPRRFAVCAGCDLCRPAASPRGSNLCMIFYNSYHLSLIIQILLYRRLCQFYKLIAMLHPQPWAEHPSGQILFLHLFFSDVSATMASAFHVSEDQQTGWVRKPTPHLPTFTTCPFFTSRRGAAWPHASASLAPLPLPFSRHFPVVPTWRPSHSS